MPDFDTPVFLIFIFNLLSDAKEEPTPPLCWVDVDVEPPTVAPPPPTPIPPPLNGLGLVFTLFGFKGWAVLVPVPAFCACGTIE